MTPTKLFCILIGIIIIICVADYSKSSAKETFNNCVNAKCPNRVDLFDTSSWGHFFDKCKACDRELRNSDIVGNICTGIIIILLTSAIILVLLNAPQLLIINSEIVIFLGLSGIIFILLIVL